MMINKKQELSSNHEDSFINISHKIIKIAIKILAIIMIFVIFFSIIEVIYTIYDKLTKTEPHFLLDLSNSFEIFGSFLLVLISVEIFQNITIYIRSDVLPIKLVLATALTAIARKVIIFNFKETDAIYLFGIAGVIIALGVTYRLIDHSHAILKLCEKDSLNYDNILKKNNFNNLKINQGKQLD